MGLPFKFKTDLSVSAYPFQFIVHPPFLLISSHLALEAKHPCDAAPLGAEPSRLFPSPFIHYPRLPPLPVLPPQSGTCGMRKETRFRYSRYSCPNRRTKRGSSTFLR